MKQSETLNAENLTTQFAQNSFLYGANATYIAQLYAQYEEDPNSVDQEWRDFFASLAEEKQLVAKNAQGASWQQLPNNGNGHKLLEQNALRQKLSLGNLDQLDPAQLTSPVLAPLGTELSSKLNEAALKDALAALELVRAYRSFGHLRAKLDPLAIEQLRANHESLDPAAHGFNLNDGDKLLYLGGLLGFETVRLADLVAKLEELYCGTIGAEFMHIPDAQQREWIQSRLESRLDQPLFSEEQKRLFLAKLIEGEGFEEFLTLRYKGAKWFGLAGGEALIPGLEQLILRAGEHKVEEIVIGMPHRGRLNVLSQLVGKPAEAVFHEFNGGSYKPEDVAGSGDVKYHLGATLDRELPTGNIHLSLMQNPSHLEIVNPVAVGKTRARQDQRLTEKLGHLNKEQLSLEQRSKVLTLLLHGDASFAGQGVVQEVLGLSSLAGYSVAGSIHVIVNNQIGFTTNPCCSRSTCYSSDVAKMINAPVFHVNGDDVEAVAFVMSLAMDFRQRFLRPVVVDLYCYRRYGHNENDEPFFTQPLMYKKIRQHPRVTDIYGGKLVAEKLLTQQELDAQRQAFRDKLEEAYNKAKDFVPAHDQWLAGPWAGVRAGAFLEEDFAPQTGVDLEQLKALGERLVTVPQDFNLHKTVARFLETRTRMLTSGENLDWGTGEALAFASLLLEGTPIRISGEDVERGTFSHRHSVFYDQENASRYVPLNNLAANQAFYEPVNSMLSEEAVLGYEYGYSLANPHNLVLWEAQFGDFANGGQVIFDQFLSASEQKWLRVSGLVCLLPHGFEGQGPEHSSARLERYLQLCAEDNMQVANCTTPANYFHILRRQMHRDLRKPLILMTPKSLLRHKRAVSDLSEFALGQSFQPVLLDDAERRKDSAVKLQKDSKIRRVVLCSGKVYYDLLEEREKRGLDDVYLLRLEQLYPFPAKLLGKVLARFKQAELVWCQEEPKNMGSWQFVTPYLEQLLADLGLDGKRISYVGRPASASPACGLTRDHAKQLAAFVDEALR